MQNFDLKNENGRSLLAECGTDAPQSGRSMIEMLGVLAIIGVLSVGGIAGYSKAMMKYRINKTIEQITLIAGNVRAFFAPQRSYTGATCYYNDGTYFGQSNGDGCPVVKKAKILPDEIVTLNNAGEITAITNAFGGQLDVFGSDNDLRISLTDIPEEACIELFSQDWTNANVNYIVAVVSGGSYYSAKVPASVDNAIDLCTMEGLEEVSFSMDCKDCWIKDCLIENGGCI